MILPNSKKCLNMIEAGYAKSFTKSYNKKINQNPQIISRP